MPRTRKDGGASTPSSPWLLLGLKKQQTRLSGPGGGGSDLLLKISAQLQLGRPDNGHPALPCPALPNVPKAYQVPSSFKSQASSVLS
ncbi:hypothetical protein Pmani_035938 [Petrolisthes manimaculis]|uniref:Uncharacterized protein n=1 Tax=Petrolisthes manimaculis TaxID=1843537 RepID=A0AAE1NKM7_9EUCA|nr:hypothetical protein Pmani_035938 [Petrolisthes manimaculis]